MPMSALCVRDQSAFIHLFVEKIYYLGKIIKNPFTYKSSAGVLVGFQLGKFAQDNHQPPGLSSPFIDNSQPARILHT